MPDLPFRVVSVVSVVAEAAKHAAFAGLVELGLLSMVAWFFEKSSERLERRKTAGRKAIKGHGIGEWGGRYRKMLMAIGKKAVAELQTLFLSFFDLNMIKALAI